MVKVSIAQFGKLLAYLPLYIAKRNGYFEKQGLDVEIVDAFGDHTTWDAVADGKADFGVADPLLMVENNRTSGIVVASIVQRSAMYAYAMKPQMIMTTARDFSGKNVCAVRCPSTSYALLNNIVLECKALSIPPPRIEEVDFTSELGHLKRSDIDAVMLTEPYASTASMDGAFCIFNGSTYFGNILVTGLFSKATFVDQNPHIVQGVVSAIEDALKLIHSDHLAAITLAKEEFTEIPGLFIEMGTIRLIADGVFPTNTYVSERCWYALRNIRVGMNDMPLFREFVDNSFASEAARRNPPMLEMVTMKPSWCGFGIDLKASWKNLRSWRRRKKKSRT